MADERGAVSTSVQVITPDWPAPLHVRAAFTLRIGGVSGGPYDSLNLGTHVGDSPAAVAENCRRVRETLRLPNEPVWLQQVHGIQVVDIAAPGSNAAGAVSQTGQAPSEPPIADASVSRSAGYVCAIRVADCMPVLFASKDGSVIGAAHAGWRGLAGGVLEATIDRLGVPPSHLIAWMGPSIGPENFEVGNDVRDAFFAADEDAASAFTPNARGRWQCDLYALARRRLQAIGVSGAFGGGWCTFAERDRFFSYRRDGQCGRMAALIWMEPG
jgi:polyphenol oxidase